MATRQEQYREAQRRRRERMKESGVKAITLELSATAHARLRAVSLAMFGDESQPSKVVESLLTTSTAPQTPEPELTVSTRREDATEVTADQLMAEMKRLLPPKVVERLNSEAKLYSIVLAGLGQNRTSIKKMLDKFTQKESKAAAQLLMEVLEHQNKVFNEIVKSETPARIQQMEAELQAEREEVGKLRQEALSGKVAVPAHMMSTKDAKIIKGVLHPDKLQSLTEEKMHTAFLIFQRVYR